MDTIRVLRGNRERLIPSIEKEKYLAEGYSVIGDDGTVLEQGVKSNHTLKSELEAANKRITELKAERSRKFSRKKRSVGENQAWHKGGHRHGIRNL